MEFSEEVCMKTWIELHDKRKDCISLFTKPAQLISGMWSVNFGRVDRLLASRDVENPPFITALAKSLQFLLDLWIVIFPQ